MDKIPDTTALVARWIEKAMHDLGIAEVLINDQHPYNDGICFHCQQAVEKMLKAALVFMEIEFKKSHDLTYLADLLSEKMQISEEFYEQLEILEDYAVEIRYPDSTSDPTLEEAKEAIDIVKKIQRKLNDIFSPIGIKFKI